MSKINVCPVHNEDDLICGVAVNLEEDLLRKKIAELEAELKNYREKENISRCSYCGEEGADNLERVAQHMESCKKRPENALLEHIAELNSALRFYADENNWLSIDSTSNNLYGMFDDDAGKRAREALKVIR